MKSLFTALVLACAIGAAPVAFAADDKPATKVCRYKLSDGKIKTWTCGKDQPCCASETFNLFTCGSQLLQCL